MRAVRLLIAFLAGILLYQGTVFVGGFLAAVPAPNGYFEWFGRANTELALAVLQVFVFTIPIAVLVAGGTLSVLRASAGNVKPALWSVLAGLSVCFLFWLVTGIFPQPEDQLSQTYPPYTLLWQALFPPWWAASANLAPWLGFAFAAWLGLRTKAR